MILRHPCHDMAIVITNALGTNRRLFLLALGPFGCGVLAVATSTGLAHLKGVFWGEILAQDPLVNAGHAFSGVMATSHPIYGTSGTTVAISTAIAIASS